MNNIHLGKCINDIPINKIYEGMRVAFHNKITEGLGKVLLVRKNIFNVCCVPPEPFETRSNVSKNESNNTLIIEWDNGSIYVIAHPQSKLDSIFYAEESK